VRLVGVEVVEQALHGRAHLGEAAVTDDGRPAMFDGSDVVAGIGLQLAAALGQADEFALPPDGREPLHHQSAVRSAARRQSDCGTAI
jgi:hypothetical protein